jgi:hypothetical protein
MDASYLVALPTAFLRRRLPPWGLHRALPRRGEVFQDLDQVLQCSVLRFQLAEPCPQRTRILLAG